MIRSFSLLPALLLFWAMTYPGSAQTYLLDYGGSNGATNSTPSSSGGGNYEAVYQVESESTPTLATTVPSGTTGYGVADFYAASSGGKNGNEATLGSFYYNNSNDTAYDKNTTTMVYDTNGTAGSNANNPLDLGTASATPNTFSITSGQTMTYSADFAENIHGQVFISLINPTATGAGSSDVQTKTTAGNLGVALTYISYDTTAEPLTLAPQQTFAGSTNVLNGQGGGFGTALETSSYAFSTATETLRLALSLTNNGNGTDTVAGSVYQISAIGGSATLVGSLSPTLLTLGNSTGQYNLNNSGLALELGDENVYNTGNYYNAGNITLSVTPEPAPAALLVLGALLGVCQLVRRRARA